MVDEFRDNITLHYITLRHVTLKTINFPKLPLKFEQHNHLAIRLLPNLLIGVSKLQLWNSNNMIHKIGFYSPKNNIARENQLN